MHTPLNGNQVRNAGESATKTDEPIQNTTGSYCDSDSGAYRYHPWEVAATQER